MNRRQALGVLGGASLAGAQMPAPTRPNIIFIYADDLDFDEIGCYDYRKFPCSTGQKEAGRLPPQRRGHAYEDPRMLTPHIDSLARDGVTFTRFYVTTAICTPSRYSLLSGRYASRSQPFCRKFPEGTQATIMWDTDLDPSESNLPKALRQAGYATGLVGKWHCGMGGHGYRITGVSADADPYDPRLSERLRAWYEDGRRYLQENLGWSYAEHVYFNNKEGLGLPLEMQVHNLEWITEAALNFIDQNRSRPFFLYMPLTTPHAQYSAAWLKGDPRFTPAGVLEQAPQVMPPRESIFERLRREGIDERNAPATWIDDAVGAVLTKLDDLGLAGNTLVIFASDHQSRGKYTCSEGSRVPLVARWPRSIQPGTRIDSIAANIDVSATLQELAGARPYEDVDGASFASLLRGGQPAGWRESLYLECSNIRGVVSEHWKYIANRPPEKARQAIEADALEALRSGRLRQVSLDGAPNPHRGAAREGIRYGALWDFPHYFDHDQLYSLDADVFEQDNLACDPSFRKIVANHQDWLRDHMKTLPHTFGEFKER